MVVSLYNAFIRGLLRRKQILCRWLGGNDLDARVRWTRRLFPISLWRLKSTSTGCIMRSFLMTTLLSPTNRSIQPTRFSTGLTGREFSILEALRHSG